MLTKRKVLELLWGVVTEDPKALTIREDAAKDKNKYWLSSEWIFIKDIEVNLKTIYRQVNKDRPDLRDSIIDMILLGSNEEKINNFWISQGLDSCRESLAALSNPE